MHQDPRCIWLNEKSARYRALSARVIDKQLARICCEHGMETPICLGDFQFLSAVAEAKTQDVSMAQIAKLLGVNPSSATRRNRRLLECGLVSNQADARDERRYMIALTEKGRGFYADMDDAMRSVVRRMYSTITEEEMNAVFTFTEKCLANLQDMLDED